MDSRRSLSPKGGSTDTNTTGSDAGDDGEQSDPEDSETPWTCNIVVKRIASSSVATRSRLQKSSLPPGYDTAPPDSAHSQVQQPRQQQIKVKVATISPTPHHPKVVSLLKIPFPLPDIEVEQVRARKRVTLPPGVAKPISAATASGKSTGLSMFGNKESTKQTEDVFLLTAEEIKDVVASTAFWLVVREGMGGVGKVSRKGDGWRLRG
jgi:hypothetical protein